MMIENDPKIETAALTGSTLHAVNIKSLPLSEDPAIQRIRKRIIIIAGILLGISLIFLTITIVIVGLFQGRIVAQALIYIYLLIAIVYNAFGIFVAFRYSAVFLRVFSWLSIIGVVLNGLLAAFFIFAVINAIVDHNESNHSQFNQSVNIEMSATAVLCTCIFTLIDSIVLLIFNFIFASKLARLIGNKKNTINQQI